MASATLFTAFSIGTALAPNLASFFVFRILTAFQGTAFLVVGSAVIGDIYKPVSSLEPLLLNTALPRLRLLPVANLALTSMPAHIELG